MTSPNLNDLAGFIAVAQERSFTRAAARLGLSRSALSHCIVVWKPGLPTYGGLYVWEFERSGQSINVKVQGQATFNNGYLMLQAALDGLGLRYGPLDMVQPHIDSGGAGARA
ncbi:LysR family transcriptional regulator [Pseudomonas viridiflava]|uniref:LysR family transcriptional regulator n=1 Tax=Pseudomonas viridiflava TaxID=33069 RepID=UPI001E4732CD|nr:LysR family transcriptional regulator [Pseudomonas viridiflava]